MRVVLTLAFVSLVSVTVGCAPEGSSAYVSFNIPPDGDCLYSPTSNVFISSGLYDIGRIGAANDDPCKPGSYSLHLIVNSNLKSNARDSTGRAEPNVLQITEADVRLMDKNKATLAFSDLPNPFRVQTANSLRPSSSKEPSMGVVAVEAIPRGYASKLEKFANDNILVEVQIYGTTTGDVEIDFRPFVYPVSICRGCLTLCADRVTSSMSDPNANQCPDNAGADGRYCIDPDCS